MWGEILASCGTPTEFLGRVRSSFPRDYVLYNERLVAFCEREFRREPDAYSGRTRDEFRELDAMKDWVETNLLQVRLQDPSGPRGGPQSPPLILSRPLAMICVVCRATASTLFGWRV